ncbi:MAG: 16S rRNA (guanine(966)-N(2))-methyltransferase RsmD [Oscillatoriaceae bacterium SKW80]|nr:16S rRNA (guanine(966)-N(2))-methyltransferase RsmD [Oscillatoriaceae bacterium SKYG93]MCX8122066.1 16S rRNA (guanine(966)-N(2))-methyltransferase RsmD [Oscillatoriaceae bacterium SKW80]MDW8454353.1 16S rRNA (guanine(966)-N(2))-methyltransferase RsmD [Oscillatoriaceae cyanobacterium SKYGB_i_bin93]HIK29218.1 16S rRNA (guanine(966)-N(2))-methyltransferase RsmD [Oscillatoriaceae cyanobacterium M7585_C2015_266]
MSLRIYGNRQLKTLLGLETRPTPARVREAVFNIWQGEIAGCRWLDLCAGAGAMSAEALCRGAAEVVAIEKSDRACRVIRENLQKIVGSAQSFYLLRGDVVQKLKTLAGRQFDRIYFDPPYASDLYKPVLEALAHYRLLAEGGELAVEHSPYRLPIEGLPELQICRQKVYGNTALTFYQVAFEPGLRD